MRGVSRSSAAAPRAHRRGAWPVVLAGLLAGVQAVLLFRAAWDKSDTADEPYYLTTAAEQWREGDFGDCDAPALPKWAFAAALRLSDPPLLDPEARVGRHPLWSRPLPTGRRNLVAARTATLLATVGAGLLLWDCGRRFGSTAALVTHGLWCFSPTVLAQGSLATLDAWVTAFGVVTLWTGLRLLEGPSMVRAASLGAALALTAACKVTGLVLGPAAAAVLAVGAVRAARKAGRPLPRTLGALGGAAAAAFLVVLAAVYGFRVGEVDLGRLCGKAPGAEGGIWGPLPFAPWLEGLVLQWRHGSQGHLSYLFGSVGGEGWWWFYLACLGLKTTLGAQAVALLGLGATARSGRSAWGGDALLLATPALLLFVLSAGKAQNGVRYLLPAFPFAMLWAGRAAQRVAPAFGRLGAALLATALAGGAAESLAVHPHHLMFFNLWAGGPAGGPRYLVHGDDWGQDQRRLAEWQQERRPWRLYYTYYSGRPQYWGVTFERVPCEPRPGFYALHAVEVHRPKRLPAGCLDWLTVEPPDARLGFSIYLYLVTKDRIARLEAERGAGRPFWRSGADGP